MHSEETAGGRFYRYPYNFGCHKKYAQFRRLHIGESDYYEVEKFGDNLEQYRKRLETLKSQLEIAKAEMAKEFPKKRELKEKTALLDMDKKENTLLSHNY